MSLASRFVPLLNRVLVEVIPKSKKTAAGIIIPEPKEKSYQTATVISVGSEVKALKAGNRVLLSMYGGSEIKLGEKSYMVFREPDIIGILPEDATSS